MHQILRHNQPIIPNKSLARRRDTLLAVLCEREVADARVTAVQRPFGFAVADDEAAGWHYLCFPPFYISLEIELVGCCRLYILLFLWY